MSQQGPTPEQEFKSHFKPQVERWITKCKDEPFEKNSGVYRDVWIEINRDFTAYVRRDRISYSKSPHQILQMSRLSNILPVGFHYEEPRGWLVELMLDFESSKEPAVHAGLIALLVDKETILGEFVSYSPVGERE